MPWVSAGTRALRVASSNRSPAFQPRQTGIDIVAGVIGVALFAKDRKHTWTCSKLGIHDPLTVSLK